jgi:hypothetical protein
MGVPSSSRVCFKARAKVFGTVFDRCRWRQGKSVFARREGGGGGKISEWQGHGRMRRRGRD